MYKGLIIIIIGLLVLSSFPLASFAEENKDEEIAGSNNSLGKYSTKDEVIYGKLDMLGHVNNMYVVNTFHVTGPGKIVDYGDYTDIRNLTDLDRKSTRLNSSHVAISYAVFCLKKKTKKQQDNHS